MLTQKDYCDYTTSVALVELGMRITSRKVYSDRDTLKHSSRGITYTVRTASAMGWVIAIPLYEAQKWLREEKKVIVVIVPYTYNIITETNTWTYEIWLGDNLEGQVHDFKTYEEALSEGIKEAVKILKEV